MYLRWVVTTEDTENANVLRTCLLNFDKSRPFFLGFLGQRRGGVPKKEDISSETSNIYLGVLKNMAGKSVTEMEYSMHYSPH